MELIIPLTKIKSHSTNLNQRANEVNELTRNK